MPTVISGEELVLKKSPVATDLTALYPVGAANNSVTSGVLLLFLLHIKFPKPYEPTWTCHYFRIISRMASITTLLFNVEIELLVKPEPALQLSRVPGKPPIRHFALGHG